jgi:ketosteroid isomerase-like protein
MGLAWPAQGLLVSCVQRIGFVGHAGIASRVVACGGQFGAAQVMRPADRVAAMLCRWQATVLEFDARAAVDRDEADLDGARSRRQPLGARVAPADDQPVRRVELEEAAADRRAADVAAGMTAREPLTIARVYHDAWTAKDFDRASALLADNFAVEVPVNHYPSAASFAAALRAFGSMTRGVELLSAMSAGDEAMLLYDMDVEGLGVMRVVEHFTIRNGKIARLRQIHDTAALRAAGFVGAEEAA